MAAGLGSSRLLFGLVEGPVLVSAADGARRGRERAVTAGPVG